MYQVIRYLSTWEVYNTVTKSVVMEEPIPYNESNNLSIFWNKVGSCKSDQEVLDLYEEIVRKWADE